MLLVESNVFITELFLFIFSCNSVEIIIELYVIYICYLYIICIFNNLIVEGNKYLASSYNLLKII